MQIVEKKPQIFELVIQKAAFLFKVDDLLHSIEWSEKSRMMN